ncbi:MAG: large conductance mechanosensitive channel protein MscL [Planctomycetes bacterium]|nr:large conductance mechanosensitive channel protein MscL [Planctomycetota bacterium]
MVDPKNLIAKVEPGRYAREFREFLLKTNMFALAMGVVIGGAVTKVVTSIVEDLVMPIVGVITPSGDWRHIRVGFWRFNWTLGHFLGTALDFVIIATVVFLITKMFVKQAPPPPTKACAACKEGNHHEATRCKWCTSELPKVELMPPAA